MVKSHEQRLFNAKRIVFYPYKYYQRREEEEEEREEERGTYNKVLLQVILS